MYRHTSQCFVKRWWIHHDPLQVRRSLPTHHWMLLNGLKKTARRQIPAMSEILPIYADDRADGVDCNFECVEATPKACSAVNPKEPVPATRREHIIKIFKLPKLKTEQFRGGPCHQPERPTGPRHPQTLPYFTQTYPTPTQAIKKAGTDPA